MRVIITHRPYVKFDCTEFHSNRPRKVKIVDKNPLASLNKFCHCDDCQRNPTIDGKVLRRIHNSADGLFTDVDLETDGRDLHIRRFF